MIEQSATVLRVEENNVTIQVNRQTACGSCSAKSGCGKSLLDNVFKSKPLEISVPNTIEAKKHDEVIVGLNESAFVQASFYLYVFPLVSLLVFSFAADKWFSPFSGEFIIIISGIAGLFFGGWLTKVVLNKIKNNHRNYFEPKLIKVVSQDVPINFVNNT